MSTIDKCDYVRFDSSTRMIIRKRKLYLRDFNPITDSVELNIAMISKLKTLLELVITIDAKGYISIIFNLDAWENYIAGRFTGKEAAKNGWQNLINHYPTNSIIISIDKYPKLANSELGPDEIRDRIRARDLYMNQKDKIR